VSDLPQFLAPGSIIRFRVEDEVTGLVGASWMLQTRGETGDVYIAHREGGRWVHSSLHDSGEWHFAVSPAARGQLTDGESAYMGVTTEHEEFAPGWLHAKRITVARSELRNPSIDQVKAKAFIAIPTFPDHEAVSIDVFLADADAPVIQIDSAFPVAGMGRGDGGQVYVIARLTTIGRPIHDIYAPDIAAMRAGFRERGWDGSTTVRGVLFEHDEERGFQREIEVAIDPD
jgi:hypothetical protein